MSKCSKRRWCKLGRLGKNLKHLVQTYEYLTKRKIGFKVLSGQCVNIDTTSNAGKEIQFCKELKITRATMYKYIFLEDELRDYVMRVLNL